MENERNINKKLDPIADNLSRPTTHDAPLIGGSQPTFTTGQFTTGTGYTGTGFNPTTEFTPAINPNLSTGIQNYETSFIPSTQIGQTGFTTTSYGTDLHRGTEGRDVFVPDSKFNTGLVRENVIPTVNTTTQMPIITNTTNTGLTSGTTTGMGDVTTGQEKSHGLMGKVKGLFRGKHETKDEGDIMVTEGTVGTETEKKQGFFSKITSHIPLIGHKNDTTTTTTNTTTGTAFVGPTGILDEKGTTVGVPVNVAGTANYGLPVAGPDYTHGTHGHTHDTVFTGGFQPTQVADTSLPLKEGTYTGTGLTTGLGTTGINSGYSTGLNTGMGTTLPEKPVFGVDYSGTNATHVNRDITLQEGGLLGLRQGAVTANPGDIITNYDEVKTTNVTQPVLGTGVNTTQNLTTTTGVMGTGTNKTTSTGFGTTGF